MFLSLLPLGARWTYACINLITAAKNSWIASHGYTEGGRLGVLRVYAPIQIDPMSRVYVDQFTFSSESINGMSDNVCTCTVNL